MNFPSFVQLSCVIFFLLPKSADREWRNEDKSTCVLFAGYHACSCLLSECQTVSYKERGKWKNNQQHNKTKMLKWNEENKNRKNIVLLLLLLLLVWIRELIRVPNPPARRIKNLHQQLLFYSRHDWSDTTDARTINKKRRTQWSRA